MHRISSISLLVVFFSIIPEKNFLERFVSLEYGGANVFLLLFSFVD